MLKTFGQKQNKNYAGRKREVSFGVNAVFSEELSKQKPAVHKTDVK